MHGLEETGIADTPTWVALLGPQLQPVFDPPADAAAEPGVSAPSAAAQAAPPPEAAAAAPPAWDILFPGAPADSAGQLAPFFTRWRCG